MAADLLCQPSAPARARLILLHGWGADAGDLMPLGQALAEAIAIPLELVALLCKLRLLLCKLVILPGELVVLLDEMVFLPGKRGTPARQAGPSAW